ncbi:hypothetical protein CEUSTIGMA_g1320.t1 [Chlamydomonas eustigma]|uniref:Phosphodiesterase n=1 Tax=Chlamydomonas eustigma TaxID=1157962 RepID=A0A250WTL3_9CHLO|nr:hypothetical protein CEUSTIGMA_g1320.t1 [Chlamydomonas eustigma]|eukprot:GAX73870.1 hypothetical protein CEUSTIGMA_g1320.t1 [Chlamydomonas eustigma]
MMVVLRSWLREIRERPSVTLLSLIILACLLLGCELGLYEGAKLWETSAKASAQSLANSAASAFVINFDLSNAPISALQNIIQVDAISESPATWSSLSSYLAKIITGLSALYSFKVIQILPNGVDSLILPPGVADADLGINLLTFGSGDEAHLTSQLWPGDVVIGPGYFHSGGWGVNIIRSIFVDKAVDMAALQLPTNVNASAFAVQQLSINPAGQWWGFILSDLDLSSLLNGTDPSLSRLNADYDYILWQPGTYSNPGSPTYNPNASRVNIAFVGRSSLNDPITVPVNVSHGNSWYLDVQPKNAAGWRPSWELPLFISMPFLCIILSLLVLSHSIEHSKHSRLLRALLPDNLISMYSSSILEPNSLQMMRSSSIDSSAFLIMDVKQQKRIQEMVEGTTADTILNVVGKLMEGHMPPIEEVVAIRQAIEQRRDLYAAPAVLKANVERNLSEDVANYVTLMTLDTSMKVDARVNLTEDAGKQQLLNKEQESFVTTVSDYEILLNTTSSDNIQAILSVACNDFKFDVRKLRDATNDHALPILALYILTVDTQVASDLNLNLQKLSSYLNAIEAQYNSNPYHNKTHAADVLQMLHVIVKLSLSQHGFAATPLSKLAYVIAALVHDVDHAGVNNDFLINSRDPLAIVHNDRSPMESHHCHQAFSLLYTEGSDFTASLSTADQRAFRSQVIDLVLATDMKQHFNILSQFTTSTRLTNIRFDAAKEGHQWKAQKPVDKVDEGMPDSVALNNCEIQEHCASQEGNSNFKDDGDAGQGPLRILHHRPISANKVAQAPSYTPKNEGESLIGMQVALKVADIGSIFRPLPVALRSIEGLEQEFFLQGDKEKARGMPVTPLFDRAKIGASKAQKGFIDFIAMPLLSSFARVFPECEPLLHQLIKNYGPLSSLGESGDVNAQ